MVSGNTIDTRTKFTFAKKQRVVSWTYTMDISLRMPTPTHADYIESNEVGEGAMRHPIRDHVGANATQPHDHCAFANANELPYRHAATEHHMIANRDVTTEDSVVSEHYVVTNFAIVGNM